MAAFTLEWRGRRRAELAARTAAGQLRTVTATMREGVIAYDMGLQLSFVNPAFERLTGFVAEDLRDQEFLQHVHPDDRPALLPNGSGWPGRLAPRPGVPAGYPRRPGTLVRQRLGAAPRRARPPDRLSRHQVRHSPSASWPRRRCGSTPSCSRR